ncbi:MAG: type II toxin-antitoxin system RelE/ParE family toxin [Sphingomonas sp.]|nr:type II toxin-antitoxin system RelE/ParE family toxin [Sphingomonas sp.]
MSRDLRSAAVDDLESIEAYIAEQSSADIAESFAEAIVERCFELDYFPLRGAPRDDIRAGVRTIPFRRSVTIVYVVQEPDVAILGIFYGGRDIGALMVERDV